jgi:hypothetical protein
MLHRRQFLQMFWQIWGDAESLEVLRRAKVEPAVTDPSLVLDILYGAMAYRHYRESRTAHHVGGLDGALSHQSPVRGRSAIGR